MIPRIVVSVFLAVLAGCAWFDGPSAGRIPFGRVYKVGIAPWTMDGQQKKNIDAFLSSLENAGYTPNTNLEVKIEDAGGNPRTQEQIVREFSSWKADVIYVMTADGAQIAKKFAPDIPIVFSGVAFPLEHGLVERLEFSGNQMAGVRSYISIEEQMAFLLRLVPREIRRIGVCMKTGNADSRLFLEEIRALAVKQGTEVVRIEAQDVSSLSRSLGEYGSTVDAFYLACDDLMQGQGTAAVTEYAIRNGVPILSCGIRAVEKGALAGAVVDEEAAGRLAGGHAAQILDGRTPTSLQTLSAGAPRLVVNRHSARAQGIRIPPTFMGDEVKVYE